MEIHGLLRQGVVVDKISSQLSPWASALFEFLPPFIRRQLLLYPEFDDSAQLSQIETEKLLAYLVEEEINKRLVWSLNLYFILSLMPLLLDSLAFFTLLMINKELVW
ncbi:hypothetical protein PHAVU_004G111200 [Phaseolus vulgaris]|uniref:Uncharacterized protein n=1 Tax=Phaseolus vulgaris TaxID=3885 RepID=V7C4C2_PHAVU|nr:hypothetical protein PHAVU_004G111200g [Phaseolus vulgaris]ESW24208.1 hypothetical protein PHAVU_004G111200g [Phaseolus vulgaris]